MRVHSTHRAVSHLQRVICEEKARTRVYIVCALFSLTVLAANGSCFKDKPTKINGTLIHVQVSRYRIKLISIIISYNYFGMNFRAHDFSYEVTSDHIGCILLKIFVYIRDDYNIFT